MKDSSNSPSFKNVLGGFKKSDVIAYITEENKKFSEAESNYKSKIAELQSQIDTLNTKLAEKENSITAEIEALTSTIDGLKTAITERDRAIEQSNETVAYYKAENDANSAKCETLKSELDILKSTIDETKKEYSNLSSINSELEAEIGSLVNERDSLLSARKKIEDELIKATDSLSDLESKIKFSQNDKQPDEPCHALDTEDLNSVSYKAIHAIKSIKSEVEDYMSDCVGEFDSCSHDVSTGIYKLLSEINSRCKLLEARINKSREKASFNINSHFEGFGEFDNFDEFGNS